MRHMIRLSDFTKEEVLQIFDIADEIKQGKYKNYLQGKTVVMFFPPSSIRTRVTFEKGIYLLGGQSILFTSDSLDKKEEISDVVGYLNNWVDAVIVRHKDICILEQMTVNAKMPIINAMTDRNHPCEMMADMYALSKIRDNFVNDKYLFVGVAGNIGYAWTEAAELMGFSLDQCCPFGYEIEGLVAYRNLDEAVKGKDAVKEMEEISRPRDWREEFADYKKQHPEMDVDEMIDSFDDYYNGLWDKYNTQHVNREIRTRGR